MNELVIAAKLENMDEVLDFVGGWIIDCPTKIQNQIKVAVDEIFSNIARYSCNPDSVKATVRVAVDDGITIEFEDSGMAYNPLTADNPDTTLSAEERGFGGLGIFIVRNIMDSIEYRREENKNILTVKKKWTR